MSDPKRPRRGDWVRCALDRPDASPGFVKRVARDGSWADVRWRQQRSDGPDHEWTKRMPCSALVVLHTIPFPGGTATDMTRQKELEG
ncbi:MAG TPA: hypothetical protein VFO09_05510 [Methyloceanibacter sp.]|nr:hypothetical protein [Methyloceanibacter sp.]